VAAWRLEARSPQRPFLSNHSRSLSSPGIGTSDGTSPTEGGNGRWVTVERLKGATGASALVCGYNLMGGARDSHGGTSSYSPCRRPLDLGWRSRGTPVVSWFPYSLEDNIGEGLAPDRRWQGRRRMGR
jgi:hypothetical protein